MPRASASVITSLSDDGKIGLMFTGAYQIVEHKGALVPVLYMTPKEAVSVMEHMRLMISEAAEG